MTKLSIFLIIVKIQYMGNDISAVEPEDQSGSWEFGLVVETSARKTLQSLVKTFTRRR